MANSLTNQQQERICLDLYPVESVNAIPVSNSEHTCAKNSKREKFDEFLIEAIDEAISSLGEPVKNTLYMHLENDFKIEKCKIPDRIDDFSFVIHKIFGLGASRLEIKFMKNLCTKIKASGQSAVTECDLSEWIVMDMPLKEHVDELRASYESP